MTPVWRFRLVEILTTVVIYGCQIPSNTPTLKNAGGELECIGRISINLGDAPDISERTYKGEIETNFRFLPTLLKLLCKELGISSFQEFPVWPIPSAAGKILEYGSIQPFQGNHQFPVGCVPEPGRNSNAIIRIDSY